MATLHLVTGAVMPREDTETARLSAVLAGRGHRVAERPWTEPSGWDAADLVVVRSPWDYVGDRTRFLAWADSVAAMTRLANPAPVLASNTHKSYLLDLAAEGVTVPALHLVPAAAEAAARAAALDAHSGTVVIKPAVGNGGRGAARLDASSADAEAFLAAATREGDVVVQDFCPEVATCGEVSLIFIGGAFSHAVRKVPAPGDYRVHRHYGGSVVEHRPTQAQLDVAERTLAHWPAPLLYGRVDVIGADPPAVMEVELVEPELFLDVVPKATDRLADAIERAAARD